MAEDDEQVDVQKELFDLLLSKIQADRNPSITMMNLIEEVMTPRDAPAYARVLMDKIRGDRFPSISMMLRVRNIA